MWTRLEVPTGRVAVAIALAGALLGVVVGARPARAEGQCPNMKCENRQCLPGGNRWCTHHSGEDGGYCSTTAC